MTGKCCSLSPFAQRLINLTMVAQKICCRAGNKTTEFLVVASLDTFLCPISLQKDSMLLYIYLFIYLYLKEIKQQQNYAK